LDIQGSAVDNELAKIIYRYQKEGKPQAPLSVANVSKAIDEVLEEVKVDEVKVEEV